jgi:hypothetical protein
MQTTPTEPETDPKASRLADGKPPDVASASVPDTLASLKVDPETGLAHAEVDVRRKENGYNEVAMILRAVRTGWPARWPCGGGLGEGGRRGPES